MKVYTSCLIALILLAIRPAHSAEKKPIEATTMLLNMAKRQALPSRSASADQTPEEIREPVKLEDLIAEASSNNPEIEAARHRWEAATKRPAQVGSLPDPTVGFMYWNAGNPIPGTGVGQNTMSFVEPQFMQEIPFPGKRRLRSEIASYEAASLGQELGRIEWKVVSQVKEDFFDLWFITRSLEVLAENRNLLGHLSKMAEARYAVGKGTQADVLRSQVEISLLIDRTTQLEQKRESVRAHINSLLNRPMDTPIGRPEWRETPFEYTLEQLTDMAERNNPTLKSRALLIDRSGAALQLAKKEYRPDFSVSLGYMYFGRFPDMYDVRFTAKIPLYFRRKQRLGVEEAAAGLAESKQNFRAAAQDLFFKLKDQYLAVKTAERLARLYEKGIIPQSSASLESALSGYQVGTVDFPSVINSFTLILNYRLESYRQIVEREKALARLEELAGTRFRR